MEKENNNSITESGTDTNHNKQSVWERFMTLYTCLLPIVVCVIYIYQIIFSSWVQLIFELFQLFPLTLYMLAVYVSFLLIPIVLICIFIYDYNIGKINNNNNITNSHISHREIPFRCLFKKFRYSFIGEIVYVFTFFVMLGMLPIIYDIFDTIFQLVVCIFTGDTFQSGWAGVMIAFMGVICNYLLLFTIFIIFFYVLIRRI
ncbi:MAG: hypothetical protein IKW80_08135, partial [Thermoguttaceae bacterium]|nr:hypothetical protein [Thermoguttaceae bacterium]